VEDISDGRDDLEMEETIMWVYNDTSELHHHGVLGQKWGVRRKQAASIEKRYKNSPNQIGSDVKRMAWRKQSLPERVAKTAAQVTVAKVFAEAMVSPQKTLDKYKWLLTNAGTPYGKKAIAKEFAGIAVATAANVAVRDKLAESAMKRYDDSGKRKRSSSKSWITKEDVAETALNVSVNAAIVGSKMFKAKVRQAEARRSRNENIFNSWGGNILGDPSRVWV